MPNENNGFIFGERLKQLREERGQSLEAAGAAIGVGAMSLSRYERGVKGGMPTLESMRRIADHYNVSLDYLAGLSDVRTHDIEMKAVCKRTGLSEAAVEALQRNAEGRGDTKYGFLSYFIEGLFEVQGMSTVDYHAQAPFDRIRTADYWDGVDLTTGFDSTSMILAHVDTLVNKYREYRRKLDAKEK